MSKIKYIFRDFWGVVAKLDFKKNSHMAEIAKVYNIDRKELWKYTEKPFETFRRGETDEKHFRKSLSQNMGVPTPKSAKKVFHTNPITYAALNKSIVNFIKRVKKLGYISILLSDVYPPTRKLTSKLGRYNFFEDTILSCDIGLSKFDDTVHGTTKIFDYALKKYKIQPQEVIFIDDVEKNCIVAQHAGIKSIVAKGPRYTIKEVKKILKI